MSTIAIGDAIGKMLARLFHANGIMSANAGAISQQHGDNIQRRRVAHIIRMRFEGEAQNSNLFALQRAANSLFDPPGHGFFAIVININHGLDNFGRRVKLLRGAHQRQRVFWKARAPIAGPGMEEFRADAAIKADAFGNFLHIGANFFTQIRHLIDESNFGRQKSIGGIFNQLGSGAIGKNNRRFV